MLFKRTIQKYIEENLNLFAFEFKWNKKKYRTKAPKVFQDVYQNTLFEVITLDNYQKFIGLE